MNGGNGGRWREWEPVPRIIIICQLYQGHSWLTTLIDILHDPRRPCGQLTRSLGALLILLLLPEINQVNLSGHAIHCVQSAPYLVGGFLPPSVLRRGELSFSFIQVNAVGEFHNKFDLVIEIFDTPATRTTWRSIEEEDSGNSHLRLIVSHWSTFEPYWDYANMYWLESTQDTIKNSIQMFPFSTKEPKAFSRGPLPFSSSMPNWYCAYRNSFISMETMICDRVYHVQQARKEREYS